MSIFIGIVGTRVVGGVAFSAMSWPERLFQFWLNFAGAAAGWIIVYAYVTRPTLHPLGFADLVLMLGAFVGVTGFLPGAVVPSTLGVGRAIQGWVNTQLRKLEPPQPPGPVPPNA
jgi:hypothetical protein